MTPRSTAIEAQRSRRFPVSRAALRTGALVLALVPAAATLTSCGFDYPTDKVNTIAAGVNERATSVDALGIRVLATGKGEGRLIGSLANNNDDVASLDQVSSPEGSVTAAAFTPIEVAANRLVNLANQPAIGLSGDFTAGQVVPLELTFSTGETARLRVPVVKPCFQYTQVPSRTAEATDEAEATESGATDEAVEEGAEAVEEADGAGGDATYECAGQAPAPEGAH